MSEEEAVYEAPQAEEPAPPKRRGRQTTEEDAFKLPDEKVAVDVKVVLRNKETALIQYYEAGRLRRGYVPVAAVQEDKVFYEDLDAVTPYGAEWESIVKLDPTPAAIASALRAVGVWTFEDMALNRRSVESAILKLLRDELSDWIRTAKEAAHG